MVIPGSHKSNLIHPAFGDGSRSLDAVEGAVEVSYKAGDALFFVDCSAHGSAERVNEGERRILVFRYGPHWGGNRYGLTPSPELISRLTPERLKIVQPLPPIVPPGYTSLYSPLGRGAGAKRRRK